MRSDMLGVFSLALAISATQARAEDFVLSGDQRWLVIGTYENPEVAIAYARGGSREGSGSLPGGGALPIQSELART